MAFSSESCYDVQFGDGSKKTGGRAEGGGVSAVQHFGQQLGFF